MNKRVITGVLVLMSISLLGIVGLQLYWINDAIQVKQEQFGRSVNEALTKVVAKLETQEAVSVVTDNIASLNKPADTLDIAAIEEAPAVKTQSAPSADHSANKPLPAQKKSKDFKDVSSTDQSSSPKGGRYLLFSKSDSVGIKHVLRSISGTKTTIVPSVAEGANSYQRFKGAQLDSISIRRLRKGGIYHLEQVPDTIHSFTRINNRPFSISADSLKRMAVQLDSLKKHINFTNVFRPIEIASIDVRNDSIFIYKKDNLKPTIIRSGVNTLTTSKGVKGPSVVYFKEAALQEHDSPSAEDSLRLPVKGEKDRALASQPAEEKGRINLPAAKGRAADIERIEIKKDKLNDVVQKMVVEYVVKDVPLQNRMNLQDLQSLISSELKNQGIHLDFGYWVVSGKSDTITAQNVQALRKYNLPNYKASLFPNDIIDKQDYLGIYFPDSQAYAIKSLWGMLSLSALFTLVIIATFGTTIHIIYRQKKLSEMKNDFINNMTHEFKTPIATISLATDSITNPKIYENPDKIKYYTNIIKQENKRMNTQVENVLQIALLEKNDYKLNFKPVDVHELILRAIESIRLQVEERMGRIDVQLQAMKHELRSDEVHLFNVICNLLDNANKYSPATPEIRLITQNKDGGILIAVEDKGVGMSKETQQRVFDKFYRVSTGNIHNVKGFGLGLSYVKAIVQAHQGNVRLKSEQGKGSCFEVFLPISEE